MGKHLQPPDRMRRKARAAAVLGAFAVAGSASLLQAPPASAGILPSTTTVSASPTTSYINTPVTVTATVSLLGLPGLLVTPTGTVSFAFDRGTTHVNIGSATIAGCLLTTCTVSRTTSSLPGGGAGTITASYSGDTFLAPSSATTPVTVNFLPEPP
ncbi:MAG TPA: Ig-like domain repeat protein, partial [Mycobacteriales bacterium]|nr:Ig-like domain repeat protein [Mycobacteriales bacterium]